MFSSRSFTVSGLTFRSLIHFEFIFVYGIRMFSSFILLQVVDQFSQHHLLKSLSFLYCIFLPPLSKIRCPQITWINLWTLYLVPLVYISISVPAPYCLDDYSFVVQTKVRQVDSSSSVLLSLDYFVYSRFFFYFHSNFEIICSSSVNNTIGSLMGIALNLQIALGSIVIFTVFILPVQEYDKSLLCLCHLLFLLLVSYGFLSIDICLLRYIYSSIFYTF